MTYLTHSLPFFFSCLSMLLCLSIGGSRPAHGPAYLNPYAFSPEAYDFFHPQSSLPNNIPPRDSPSSSSLSPSPSPSKTSNVEADTQGSKFSSEEHRNESIREEGRGETVGIVLGVSFAAFILMGAYFVIKKRRANITRTICFETRLGSAVEQVNLVVQQKIRFGFFKKTQYLETEKPEIRYRLNQ
ncbi:hypothetical protein YC2023_118957 [Brassica napus]